MRCLFGVAAVFFRLKPSGERQYLQIVENQRDGAKTRQRVIATLGRADELAASGQLDVLLRSARATVRDSDAGVEPTRGYARWGHDASDRRSAGVRPAVGGERLQ